MIRICSILIILLLFTAGCSTGRDFSYDLTIRDAGNTLNLKTGDTVRIVLESNPSTGYFWAEDGRPDSDVIRLVSKQFLNTAQGKNLSGAPGLMEFIYKAVGSGETGIRLSYKRPWEKKLPVSTFQLRIVIKPETSFLDRLDRSKEPLKRVDSKGRVAPALMEGSYK